MSTEYVVKPLPALRLAGKREVLDPKRLSALVGPLFGQVRSVLETGGHTPSTPVATYLMGEAGMEVVVGFVADGVPVDEAARAELELIDVPAEPEALCTTHHGPMDGIQDTWEALFSRVEQEGRRPSGPCREVYLRADSEDQFDWITELQQPVSGS